MNDVTVLPDGSAFGTMSFPLPANHWLTQPGSNVPPMPWRCGEGGTRSKLAEELRAAGRYAVRCATMNGKDQDFDPDALLQSLIVGMLGYWTADGTCGESWADPSPLPPRID